MSEKHTPGPWSLKAANGARTVLWRVLDAAGHVVATIGRPFQGVETADANARLIASAPELLEALQEFVNHIVPNDPNDPLWIKARAAIAKATGEQS